MAFFKNKAQKKQFNATSDAYKAILSGDKKAFEASLSKSRRIERREKMKSLLNRLK